MRFENEPDIRVKVGIDFSDLTMDLAETLTEYGYYGEQAAKAWGRARRARQAREDIAGQFYFISKDDVLDTGRPPSDKYIEMELTQDKDWKYFQRKYSKAKVKAESASVLVKTLEYKLESLRTFLANERQDKIHHLKD